MSTSRPVATADDLTLPDAAARWRHRAQVEELEHTEAVERSTTSSTCCSAGC